MGLSFLSHLFLCLFFAATYLFLLSASCSNQSCQLLDSCSVSNDCRSGLICSNCPPIGKNKSICIQGQAANPANIVKGLPFNKYSWIVTHNAFSILGEPSLTGTRRVTFYNQEDSVTNQLKNGVRGLMLDMYDFRDDIWLCHSFGGKCYNFTAFEPAINTLKEVEAFLTSNPTEIVTIILEDYVKTKKGLTKLFTKAGLMKFWYPVSRMPLSGKDWPTITEMASKNHRLLVFSSNSSKEQEEGIAYQWRYILENQPGDPGVVPGSCPNRRESMTLDSRNASLILMNYFNRNPSQTETCKLLSTGLSEMVDTCYKAARNIMPNFVAVDYYLKSDGGALFDVIDKMNGQTLCGCSTVTACKEGSPFGICISGGTSLLKSFNIVLHMVFSLIFALIWAFM